MHTVTILGRRWFQRTYGNTYHTAQVIIDGVDIGRTTPSYGYGDQYVESAFELMAQKGFAVPTRHANGGMNEWPREWAERLGIAYTYQAVDVAREKDL